MCQLIDYIFNYQAWQLTNCQKCSCVTVGPLHYLKWLDSLAIWIVALVHCSKVGFEWLIETFMILFSVVNVARECHCWDNWIQVSAITVFCSLQREHADKDTARRITQPSDKQQKCSSAADWTNGGKLFLLVPVVTVWMLSHTPDLHAIPLNTKWSYILHSN